MEETSRKDGKRGKAETMQWAANTFLVGLLGPNTLQAEDYPNLSVLKELEASEKPDSSANSVGAKTSMIHLSDGSRTGQDPHDGRSESTNAKSVICLEIGCITDEVPTQAEI